MHVPAPLLVAIAFTLGVGSCKRSDDTKETPGTASKQPAREAKTEAPVPPAECQSECVTPFGESLGENDGVVGYSNCRPECIDPTPMEVSPKKTGLESDTYTGIKWQCVEYARRWWLLKRNAVFGSVDTADDMWTVLSHAERPGSDQKVPLERHENGAEGPPEIGDLIIYKADAETRNLKFGHVAVVVAVEDDSISVAEQNYDNRSWVAPKKFARKLALRKDDGRFTVFDEAPSREPSLGSAERIYGWLHLSE